MSCFAVEQLQPTRRGPFGFRKQGEGKACRQLTGCPLCPAPTKALFFSFSRSELDLQLPEIGAFGSPSPKPVIHCLLSQPPSPLPPPLFTLQFPLLLQVSITRHSLVFSVLRINYTITGCMLYAQALPWSASSTVLLSLLLLRLVQISQAQTQAPWCYVVQSIQLFRP